MSDLASGENLQIFGEINRLQQHSVQIILMKKKNHHGKVINVSLTNTRR